MHTRSVLTIAAFLSCITATQAVTAEEKSIVIGLIGDSTVATTYGWGPAFAKGFNDRVQVLNYAVNGATLESLSKKLDQLLEQKPDYVFIQFGHNDMKRYDASAYSEKLTDYVQRISHSGSQAIVLSSVTRRVFDANHRISPRIMGGDRSLPAFAQAARAVAQNQGVPFIDLNTITIEHHNQLGPEASAAYNFEGTDTTHFSPEGAKATASLILSELKNVVPELAKFMK